MERTLENINCEEISDVPQQDKIIQAKVVDVYDGDTFTIVYCHGNEFLKLKLRFFGFSCRQEKLNIHENYH